MAKKDLTKQELKVIDELNDLIKNFDTSQYTKKGLCAKIANIITFNDIYSFSIDYEGVNKILLRDSFSITFKTIGRDRITMNFYLACVPEPEEEKWCVYVYLDTRKPGHYAYTDHQNNYYIFDYEPFYIGKTNGPNIDRHLTEAYATAAKNKHTDFKSNQIRKIKRITKKDPIIIRLHTDLSKPQATLKERQLIQIIGRRTQKEGPLANLTDGENYIPANKRKA